MTTNEIAIHAGSALAIELAQQEWTDKQVTALIQIGVEKASKGDLDVFFHQCQRTGLDPFAKQIYMIERQGKQTIQTGIDGFRLIARRAIDQRNGTLDYEDNLWCGEDGQWTDVWLSKDQPRAAKVTVIRDGGRYSAIALWDEYKGTKYNGQLTKMWSERGAGQLAKCAEALALRKAFPQDLSGIYSTDEMQQADNGQQPQQGTATRQAAPAPAPTEPVVHLDLETFLVQMNAQTDVDKLRAMWQQVEQLPPNDRDDVRAMILARVNTVQAEAAAVQSVSDEAALDDAHAAELPLEAEAMEDVA